MYITIIKDRDFNLKQMQNTMKTCNLRVYCTEKVVSYITFQTKTNATLIFISFLKENINIIHCVVVTIVIDKLINYKLQH